MKRKSINVLNGNIFVWIRIALFKIVVTSYRFIYFSYNFCNILGVVNLNEDVLYV